MRRVRSLRSIRSKAPRFGARWSKHPSWLPLMPRGAPGRAPIRTASCGLCLGSRRLHRGSEATSHEGEGEYARFVASLSHCRCGGSVSPNVMRRLCGNLSEVYLRMRMLRRTEKLILAKARCATPHVGVGVARRCWCWDELEIHSADSSTVSAMRILTEVVTHSEHQGATGCARCPRLRALRAGGRVQTSIPSWGL